MLPGRFGQEPADGCRNAIISPVPARFLDHQIKQEFAVHAPQDLKHLSGFDIPAGGVRKRSGEPVTASSVNAFEVVFERGQECLNIEVGFLDRELPQFCDGDGILLAEAKSDLGAGTPHFEQSPTNRFQCLDGLEKRGASVPIGVRCPPGTCEGVHKVEDRRSALEMFVIRRIEVLLKKQVLDRRL